MERLMITAELQTPLITGGGYMTFDALLAGILFDQLQDVEAAHAAVPVKRTNGLFHASAAFYEPLDLGETTFIAALHAVHTLDADLFPRKKDGSSKKKFGLSRQREGGNVRNTYRSITTDTIFWDVEGDRDHIWKLIQNVPFIGKRRASGFGQVKGWSIDPGEFDGILGLMNEPLRPIPEDLYTGDPSAIREDTGWQPAYWHPENHAICYVPEVH